MKKILTLVVVALMAMNVYGAGKIVTDSIKSKVLNAVVKYNVYLPDGYNESSDTKYPVLYLLHGLHGDYQTWSNYWIGNVGDLLMANGESAKMVIIMPNAGGKNENEVRNGYFDVPGWSYETFFFTELMPQAEKKYKAIGDKGHRAVSGLSMGGGGTVSYGLKHPESFSSCYIMSGWLGMPVASAGYAFKTDCPEPQRKHFKSEMAYATSKSVWDNRPVPFIQNATPEQLAALRTVNWFIDCGDDDFLLEPNVDLHLAMRKAKIKSELRVKDGAHNREYWLKALYLMLPFVSRNFDK